MAERSVLPISSVINRPYCCFRSSSNSPARRTTRARSPTGVCDHVTRVCAARASRDSMSAAPSEVNSRSCSPVAGLIVRIAIPLGTLVRPHYVRRLAGDQSPPPGRAVLTIEERLHGIAPRTLHRNRIRKSLAGIRGQTAAKPFRDLGGIAAEVDVAAKLAGENHPAVTFAKRRLAAQRERDDRGEGKAIDRGVLLLAEQLLGRRERGRAARTGSLRTA